MFRILLVDDEPNILKSLTRFLADIECEVVTALSGIEAIDIAKESNIDVCISDYHMPGKNGIDVLKTIKTINPEIVRILITGGVGSGEIINAVNEASIYYFLQKPVDGDSFAKLVTNAVQYKNLNAEVKNLADELAEKNRNLEKMNRTLENEVRKRAGDLMEREFRLHKAVMFVLEKVSTITGNPPSREADPLDSIQKGFLEMLKRFHEKENDLKKANSHLNILLEEKARELVHSERMATIGKLAAGVAHEINNPNSIIKANAMILKKAAEIANVYPGTEEDFNITIDRIIRNSNRIDSTVSSLRNYSRKGSVEDSTISITECIDNALGFARTQFGDVFTVSQKYLHGIPHLTGNAQELTQVFLNLIANAIESCLPQMAEIEIEVSFDETSITVAVSDNGSGIPAAIADKVFEPFFTSGKGQDGTGLGLSISLGIVENHGGTIFFKQKDGSGTLFFVNLPIKREGIKL
ncbi:response regulator [Myxococcota bacterium]|nr:response regulator [Myxococcota bacterium]MBU1381997.1 response regulator [Myxococcota bacterium]MBU1497666.1 response regulator [Myxococcota bacterium]